MYGINIGGIAHKYLQILYIHKGAFIRVIRFMRAYMIGVPEYRIRGPIADLQGSYINISLSLSLPLFVYIYIYTCICTYPDTERV